MSHPEPPPIPKPPKSRRWELPPLILHPFSDEHGPETLVECSRAQLMLSGILPSDGATHEALEARVLDGRVCECKMLYYVGLDLERWLEQCIEVSAREESLREFSLSRGSFASLLINESPRHVHEKLQGWGVADYKSLFSRALGLNSIFVSAPDAGSTRDLFLLHYHVFTDGLFRSWNEVYSGRALTPDAFTFDLYASGEYSRILERQWEGDSGGRNVL